MVDVAGQGLQRPPTVQMLDPASTSAYEHIVAERRCERDKRMRNNAFATIKAANDPPRVRVQPGRDVKQPAPNGPIYMRRHTHQHTFALGVDSFHQVRLFRSWQPGFQGVPDADVNLDAYVAEIDERIRRTDRTLAALHRKCEAAVKGLLSGPDAEPLMFEMKEDINSSATRQMEFFVACTQRWAGVPLAHRAQVAQQIQASIQAGKLDLESRALENWDADVRDIYDSIPHRPNPYPPLPL